MNIYFARCIKYVFTNCIYLDNCINNETPVKLCKWSKNI